MNELNSKHLLTVKQLSVEEINLIFHTAKEFKEVINRPIKKVPALRDITIANVFFENSTRTRLSFELAERRLSTDILNFNASSSSLNKGETLLDTVKNILAMKVDILVIRHSIPGTNHFLAKNLDNNPNLYIRENFNVSIINAGDGTHEHPTQALLDAYSLREKLGDLRDKKILIVGDILHSRVALSNIFLLKKLGAKVKICAPKSLIPKYLEELDIQVEHNLKKALTWCDAANILRIQLERQELSYFPSLREYATYFGVNKNILNDISREKPIIILHPGPINRGVEITSDVADSNQAIILNQVENGIAVRMAIIFLLAQKLNKDKINS